jgi:hypothetical protein
MMQILFIRFKVDISFCYNKDSYLFNWRSILDTTVVCRDSTASVVSMTNDDA